ncbi:hypothetical protein [Actinocorallia sp. A-T 12471]|uniref:hypothetical protein n=1 Tax=Actinocorallia sp. A-T 12471 TaxID=3089813 RepID=UPI0029CF2E92|nr:hypothetical protein [Actinocorallia sp. A-T 12471]MDX6742390.1 hypothetical protein [Actinocorallia sp. A-T 12471]
MNAVPLLHGLVDDAGLFPPARLPMAAALARHRADRAAGHPMLAHRFLCPASRLGELTAALAEGDEVRVGVLLDAALPDVLDPRLTVDSAEAAVTPGEPPPDAPPRPHAEPRPPHSAGPTAPGPRPAHSAGPTAPGARPLHSVPDRPAVAGQAVAVRLYVEPRRGPGWLDAVAALAGRPGVGAKIRCGGLAAALFPSADEVAAFVEVCVRHGVPFKATAGLHHALPYRDPETGFRHHGYLNLLTATARAIAGASRDQIAATLTETDPAPLVAEARGLSAADAARVREAFVAYGSCSTEEPLADAVALGLAEGDPAR